MKITSTYSYSFYDDNLNDVKYNHILNKCTSINKFKNELSKKFNSNPIYYSEKSSFSIVAEEKTRIEGLVGKEIQPAITDVFTAYKNKFKVFTQRCSCKIQKDISTTFYTKGKKKGDLKDFKVNLKSTSLTKVLSYLTKSYNLSTVSYLISEIKKNEKEMSLLEFYKEILFYINKFGERLIKLALSRRNTIIQELFKVPIQFTKLSYRSINNGKIINKNKNKHSCLETFISLSGFGSKNSKLHIPIKYSKKYHGKILNNFNKSNQLGYFIKLEENKRIRIILTKEKERCFVEDKKETIGIDVNLKHNLFSLSNNTSIDYDRDLVSNYFKTIKKLDKKKNKLTEKDILKKQKFQRRIENHLKEKCSNLVDSCKKEGYNHLVIEDLNFHEKSFFKIDEMKMSRIASLMRLNNIKNYLHSICSKKDMQLSIIPSYFTSQRCSKCGYIDPENRKNQEEFVCLNCGHHENADSNASQNIKQYKDSDVLSLKLLVQDKKTNWFIPNSLRQKGIKLVLDDYFEQYS
jgi:transposase